jgi:hypothetical protein
MRLKREAPFLNIHLRDSERPLWKRIDGGFGSLSGTRLPEVSDAH